MKIKIIGSDTDNERLTKSVNEFLDGNIEVVDIKFSNSMNGLAVLIMYNERWLINYFLKERFSIKEDFQITGGFFCNTKCSFF